MIPRRTGGVGGSALAGAAANTPSLVAPGQSLPIASPVQPTEPDFGDSPAVLDTNAPAMVEPPRPAIAGATPPPDPMSPAVLLSELQKYTTTIPDSRITNTPIRDLLAKRGLVAHASGFTVVTAKGITYLVDFGLL